MARRDPPPALRPLLLRGVEGWAQTRGGAPELREVPFPGIPLILNLGPALAGRWDGRARIRSQPVMGTASSTVRGGGHVDMHRASPDPAGRPPAPRRVHARALEPRSGARRRYCPKPATSTRVCARREGGAIGSTSWTHSSSTVSPIRRPADPGVAWSWHHLYATQGRASDRRACDRSSAGATAA